MKYNHQYVYDSGDPVDRPQAFGDVLLRNLLLLLQNVYSVC